MPWQPICRGCSSSTGAAIAAASLMGPAQVAARLFEFGVLKRLHPLVSTRLALLMHPFGLSLAVLGALVLLRAQPATARA